MSEIFNKYFLIELKMQTLASIKLKHFRKEESLSLKEKKTALMIKKNGLSLTSFYLFPSIAKISFFFFSKANSLSVSFFFWTQIINKDMVNIQNVIAMLQLIYRMLLTSLSNYFKKYYILKYFQPVHLFY